MNNIHDKLHVYLRLKDHKMCMYYHYTRLLNKLLSKKHDIHFIKFHKLSLAFDFFLIFRNQSAAGNVIQWVKKEKPNSYKRIGDYH